MSDLSPLGGSGHDVGVARSLLLTDAVEKVTFFCRGCLELGVRLGPRF
jgi:hypothetical protein